MVKLDKALQDFWELVAHVYLTKFKENNDHVALTGYVHAMEHLEESPCSAD